MSSMKPTVHYVVLTGGPCGGKTTALVAITEWLEGAGYRVVVCPEGATTLILNGVSPTQLTPRLFQWALLDFELAKEMSFRRIAHRLAQKRQQPVVVLMDRAWHDGGAYTPEDLWREMMEEADAKKLAPLSGYDGIVHLVTAADGAEAYYTLDNNSSRFETAEQARAADRRTLAAWQGCPKLRIIPNTGTFDDKLKHLLAEICAVLGIPEPVETERRFLVRPDFNPSDLGDYELVDIEQFYLVSNIPNEALRFRKRSQNGDAVYFKTRKRPGLHPASNIETEDFITEEQYEFGKQFMLPGSRFVRKERICFVYQHQYFELDVFSEPALKYCLLELELAHPDQPMTLPPFLPIEREVTGDTSWGNYALATRS